MGMLALILVVVTGCSSFHRDWKKSAASAPPDRITGRWEGRWQSEVNEHNGRLRCLVTGGTNDVYAARFYAEYTLGFIPLRFGYTVPMRVQPRDGGFEFASNADLGWYAGGLYRYRGMVTPTNFFATYDSKHDRGTFKMTRPN